MYLNGDLNIGEIVEMSKEECMEAISSSKDGWIFGKYRLDMDSSDLTPRRRSEITAVIQQFIYYGCSKPKAISNNKFTFYYDG